MTLSVNKQQVENIISNLTNVVADAHVGMLNDNGEVTQTASTLGQKFVHWIKTKVGNDNVVSENLAILNSYKAMVTRNLGEVYCKVFSDRMHKIESKKFYSVGSELANELRSVVARYNSDLANDKLFLEVELRAHKATVSPEFKASVQKRMVAELSTRNIPNPTEGLDTDELKATITERYCHALRDFYMRNDRDPNLGEQSNMMDRAVNQAFQIICKQRCEDLCTKYTFLDPTSADSVDGKLKTALAAKELNVEISHDYLIGLVENVQKDLRNSPGFLTSTAVQNCIADVVAKALQHEHIKPDFDKLLVKNMVTTGAHSRMFTVINEAAMELNSIISVFAKNPGMTKEGLNSVLSGFCTRFMELCNRLIVQPKPGPDQQNAAFAAAVKSAVEYCLSDSPAMSGTRTLLLEHADDYFGANSAFVTNLYNLSEGLIVHTDPHAAKMLTLCRTLVSTLNEKLVNAPSEQNNLKVKNTEKLAAKQLELTDSVERCKKFMRDNPTQKVKDARAAAAKKHKGKINELIATKEKVRASGGKTQEERDKFIKKIDDTIEDLMNTGLKLKIDFSGDRVIAKRTQEDIDRVQKAIDVMEEAISKLPNEANDVSNELKAMQAEVTNMRLDIVTKQGIIEGIKEGVQLAYIDDFENYITELETSGLALQKKFLVIQKEHTGQVELQATLKEKLSQPNVARQKNPQNDDYLDGLVMQLQASNEAVVLLENEMQEVGNESLNVAHIVNEATDLKTHISTLQNDIKHLNDALKLKHLPDEELKKNSTAVKYLSTGKDFGGLLNFSDYKKVHGSVPIQNNVGLTQPEKDSLKQFINDEIKKNATKVKNIGITMNRQKAQLESQIELEPGASEEDTKQAAVARSKLGRVEQTMEGSIFLSTYGYTDDFINDLENGLSVTVNGKKLSSPSSSWSDPNKATAYSNISKEFPDIDIAGAVLSPFTLAISNKLSNAMTGDVKSIPSVGIYNDIVNYTIFGNDVQSVTDVHVDALENGQYAVTYYASTQKDNGTYAHQMFKCTVSDLDKTWPTFTVDDIDVVYHVDPQDSEIGRNYNNIEQQPQDNVIDPPQQPQQDNNLEHPQDNNIEPQQQPQQDNVIDPQQPQQNNNIEPQQPQQDNNLEQQQQQQDNNIEPQQQPQQDNNLGQQPQDNVIEPQQPQQDNNLEQQQQDNNIEPQQQPQQQPQQDNNLGQQPQDNVIEPQQPQQDNNLEQQQPQQDNNLGQQPPQDNNLGQQPQDNNLGQQPQDNVIDPQQPQGNVIDPQQPQQDNVIMPPQDNVIEQPQDNVIKDTRLADNKRVLTDLVRSGVDAAFANPPQSLPLPNRQGLTRYLVDLIDFNEDASVESLQAVAEEAISYAKANPELLEKAKLLAPMDISSDDLVEHAFYLGRQLSELCESICAPARGGDRSKLDEQGFYEVSLIDAHRDRPVINGVRLVQDKSTDVVVQDYKQKMLNFILTKPELQVLSILMSQDHLAIPGRFFMGIPPHLPLGEPFKGDLTFIRKPSATSDEVRYTLDRNGADDAVIHVSMAIECGGMLGAKQYSGGEAQVGTLSYDVRVPHNQFTMEEYVFTPAIFVENMRVTPLV